MAKQFIVLDENDKSKICENEIVTCRLNNGLSVYIVSEIGFAEWCKKEKPYSLQEKKQKRHWQIWGCKYERDTF